MEIAELNKEVKCSECGKKILKKDVIEIYINEGKTKYTCKECYNRHPKKESK